MFEQIFSGLVILFVIAVFGGSTSSEKLSLSPYREAVLAARAEIETEESEEDDEEAVD